MHSDPHKENRRPLDGRVTTTPTTPKLDYSLIQSQLLRFGEDKNSFYLLQDKDDTRLQLFDQLRQDPKSPQRWLALLRHPATYQEGNLYAQTRLFRRATTLIPKDPHKQNASFAEIWIRFAALARSEKECRDTFKFIKSEKIGEKMELFYREYAAFEAKHGNASEAESILALGVDAGAFDVLRKQQLEAQIGLPSSSSFHHTPRATSSSSCSAALPTASSAPISSSSTSNGFSRAFSTPKPSTLTSGSTTSSSWISTATTMASTLGHDSTLSSGQKLHLTRHDQQVLSMPSMTNATRTASFSRALTTSKKATRSMTSFARLGKPLRVPVVQGLEEDDDDVEMTSTHANTNAIASSSTKPNDASSSRIPPSPVEPRPPNKLSPISESEKVNNSRDESSDTFSKALLPNENRVQKLASTSAASVACDLSYIKAWKPRQTFPSASGVSTNSSSNWNPPTASSSASVSTTPAGSFVVSSSHGSQPSRPLENQQTRSAVNTTRDLGYPEQDLFKGSSRPPTPPTPPIPPNDWARTSLQHGPPTNSPQNKNINNHGIIKKEQSNDSMKHHEKIKSFGVQFSSPLGSDPTQSPVSPSVASSPVLAMNKHQIVSPPSNPLDSILNKRVIVNKRQYLLLEQIGSGGSSKVYRILGEDLKIYALKKIKLKNLDNKSIAQYQNEIKLLQELRNSPFIIHFIAADSDPQRRLLNVVMEHGELDLDQKLQQLKQSADLDEDFLRPTWKQMLRAVDVIHTNRIIHGDLKPANFVFANGALKLIDFGIAKVIKNDTTNITRHSQVGTVNYMSPEAIQGNSHTTHTMYRDQRILKVDRASDIWSLGCILYQIVYGKPPFADLHSILDKFRGITDPNYEIPFPPLKNKDLEEVMRLCLQRDHRQRPPIQGPNGLLNHPFLRGKCWTCCQFSCSCR